MGQQLKGTAFKERYGFACFDEGSRCRDAGAPSPDHDCVKWILLRLGRHPTQGNGKVVANGVAHVGL